jgi:hypothetical protein
MPPMNILNAPTKLMKDIGYGKGYTYDHDARRLFRRQLLARGHGAADLLPAGRTRVRARGAEAAGGYFPGIPGSPGDAISLWALVEELCATEPHLAASGLPLMPRYADHFRSQIGRQTVTGAAFGQGAGRFRVVEHRQKAQRVNPVSCFNLVGAAQVGKSSLTGMRMLHRLRGHLPVWPFDPLPAKGPVIVEIYTAIAARAAGLRRGLSKIRTMAELNLALGQLGSPPVAGSGAIDDHSADALLTAAWLRAHAHRPELWRPPDMTAEIARTEGWTFGVT